MHVTIKSTKKVEMDGSLQCPKCGATNSPRYRHGVPDPDVVSFKNGEAKCKLCDIYFKDGKITGIGCGTCPARNKPYCGDIVCQ